MATHRQLVPRGVDALLGMLAGRAPGCSVEVVTPHGLVEDAGHDAAGPCAEAVLRRRVGITPGRLGGHRGGRKVRRPLHEVERPSVASVQRTHHGVGGDTRSASGSVDIARPFGGAGREGQAREQGVEHEGEG